VSTGIVNGCGIVRGDEDDYYLLDTTDLPTIYVTKHYNFAAARLTSST